MTRALLLLLIAATLHTGCSSRAPYTSATDEASGLTQATGTVRVVGSAPMSVQVTLSDPGRPVTLVGPLFDELRALAGARIRVRGERLPDAIHVRSYEILSVEGAPVVMGTVEKAPQGGVQLRTEEGAVIQLVGAEEFLKVGQKVWVQGPSALRVQSFGILRP